MDRITLEQRLESIPRVPLAYLPTPLEPCPRLSAALGGPEIWVKRDDLTGLCFGGNKTRQIEYLFAQALAHNADIIVAGAGTQSNWCRQMTAAARRLGLDIALVLVGGEKGSQVQGNFMLLKLMGADIKVVDLPSIEHLQPAIEARAAELRATGRNPYVVAPLRLDTLSIGALGYVRAATELDAQWEHIGARPRALVVAGANMTPAGLALGFGSIDRRLTLINISPVRLQEDRLPDILRIAHATAGRLQIDTQVDSSMVENHDTYVGERYGLVTDACREALHLAASTEGLILDPVYTGKAMAGLIDQIRNGRFTKSDVVVFLHSGGTPALFAYAEDLGLH
jgi:D-cysteine desulfhydrase family pyridoxal phosphate-dependent enzyme